MTYKKWFQSAISYSIGFAEAYFLHNVWYLIATLLIGFGITFLWKEALSAWDIPTKAKELVDL